MYRLCFALAAAYHLAFGAWTLFWPMHFFELMHLHRHFPELWQSFGMMVGLYGAGYAYAAWRLDRGQPLVAIGLAGKLLGPLIYLVTVGTSWYWPPKTLTLYIFNDVIWWIPFALYLLEGTQSGQRLRGNVPLYCALWNALAALGMALFLRQGTEAVANIGDRIDYIEANPIAWRGGWLLWNAAALSLVSFYAWWGARIASFPWAAAAFLIAAVGMVFDLFFESLFIGWLPRDYRTIYPLGSFIMGVVANGAYTLAGALLTLRTPQLTGLWRLWAWAIWASGFALCAASWTGNVPAIVVTTALMMVLFCPFAAALRWKLA
jgi:hypothetical protein